METDTVGRYTAVKLFSNTCARLGGTIEVCVSEMTLVGVDEGEYSVE